MSDRMPVSGENGATAVEMAFILPVVLLVLFGALEIGRFLSLQSDLDTAAREAARYGQAVGPVDPTDVTSVPRYMACSEIEAAAQDLSVVAGVEAADVTVTYIDVSSGTVIADCDSADVTYPDPNTTLVAGGANIRVAVAGTFTSPFPLIGQFMGTIDLTATAERSIFEGS